MSCILSSLFPYKSISLQFIRPIFTGLATGDPDLPEARLKPGMIFTVEPWYYNHDEPISVFTEDVVLITDTGCEVLSKDLPRSPQALEEMMKR